MDKIDDAFINSFLRKIRSLFKTRKIKKKIEFFFEWIRYKCCLYTRKPYFGPVLAAAQTWKCRMPYMERLVQNETSKSRGKHFTILEIGSWAGHSAIIWADAIKKYNDGKGLIICIDPWMPYINPGKKTKPSPVLIRMEKALKNEKIFNLFIHNITAAQHDDIIKVYRGYSDEVLPTFREKQFDSIFVDGDHSYSQVIKDLKNCERLVCEGGIICGDDLELQKHEIEIENAVEKKDKDDCILDEKSDTYFHPGVTFAIGDFFGDEVSNYEGFWAMRKTISGWQKVELI